jgi:autotransporter-associated beta strand protein
LANLGSGQLTLNGGYLRWATGNTTDVSAKINPVLGGQAYFDTNGNDITLSTSFSGAGYLGKAGAGTLTLTGTSTFNISASIDAGTLAIGAVNALPTNRTPYIGTPATLAVNANQTLAGLSGGGSVNIGAGSTLTLDVSAGTTPRQRHFRERLPGQAGHRYAHPEQCQHLLRWHHAQRRHDQHPIRLRAGHRQY